MTQVIGTEVLRKEDPELITGKAKYIDDLVVPGMLWMHVVRSPLAHATINGVDLSRAKEMPGVVAAFSGSELADDWPGPLLMAWPVTEDIHNPPHWPLARDKARYQGDGVAVVIAETRAQAADAAEAVDVDYDPLDPVVDMEAALADGAPIVHDEFGTNSCYIWKHTNGEDVDAVFDAAPVVVKERFVIQRQVPNADGRRGACSASRTPHGTTTRCTRRRRSRTSSRSRWRSARASPSQKIRVIAPRVGGGFGSKLQVYRRGAAGALAGEAARAADQVDRDAQRELPGHPPRTRPDPGDGARRGRGREDQGVPGQDPGEHGGLPHDHHAGNAAPRRVAVRRLLQRRGLRDRVHRRVHQHHPDGRVPGRRAGPRPPTRSSGSWTRSAKRVGKDVVEIRRHELHAGVDRTLRHAGRAHHRQLGLRVHARRRARAGRLRRGPRRPTGTAGPRRHQGARHRILDVSRDVRAGAVAHPRRAAVRGRGLGRRPDPGAARPARWSSRSARRRTARDTRPRSPDRGGRPRHPVRRHRGRPLRHRAGAAGHGHVRSRVRSRSAAWPCTGRR